jgi:hypothetical protein
MQVDAATAAAYRATGLGWAIREQAGRTFMQRSGETGACVACEGGRCRIHAERGSAALGDACHFFPRVVRRIGGQFIVSATLSCPEIVRISLSSDDATVAECGPLPRVPSILAPDRGSESDLEIHQLFLDAARRGESAARSVVRFQQVCTAARKRTTAEWRSVFEQLHDLPLPPVAGESADVYRLVHVFFGLLRAGGETPVHPRLNLVLERLEAALAMRVNRTSLDLVVSDLAAWPALRARAHDDEPLLRRFLLAYLSATTFPLAGPGETAEERARILVFRFALTRLALCAFENPDFETAVLVVQELARALDHNHSPELLFRLLASSGLDESSRLLALLH